LEKWILRAAFEDELPAEIVWRDKAQFDEGTSAVDHLGSIVNEWMSPGEAQQYARRFPDARLRSAEECVYHRLLCEAYADPGIVLANVARWADRPQFQA